MKKIYNAFAILAAAAMVFSGCEKFSEDSDFGGKTVEFTVEDIATRTVFDTPDGTSYPVLWTAQDTAVAVSLNYAAPVNAKVTPSADGKTAKFSAEFPTPTGGAQFLALSPATAFAGIDLAAYSAYYTVPAQQEPSATSADQAAQVLYGFSPAYSTLPDKVSLHFKHLTAYMKVTFANMELDGAAVFSASITADTELAGKAALNVATMGISASEGSKTVTAKTSTGTDVWFGVIPTDLSGKTVTVAVKTGAGTLSREVTLPSSANLTAGKVATFSVDMSSAELTEPDRTSISILAVGNSFSVDAMQYLYDVLEEVGYSEIYLGNLYIGGCSLETHANNFANAAKSYTFYTNSAGKWNSASGAEAIASMKTREWDYVTVQQVSQYSGKPATYEPYLSAVIDSVKANCPGAEIWWHMTWAYQQSANYSQFSNYGYNQKTMYDAIVGAVQEKIVPRDDIAGIIPSGTAIQNARTSFIRDNFSRDGYHLNYSVGRLTAALMYAKALTGCSVKNLSWTPADYPVSNRELAAIKEAVDAAYDKPFAVTEATDNNPASDYTENAALRQVIVAAGYNLADYDELPYGVISNSYYNSGTNAILQNKQNGVSATNFKQFAATHYFFTKADLPKGTLLVLAENWMTRPEGWTEFKDKTTNRPANITARITVVDNAWWGSFNYRAFNIAKIGNPNLSDSEMANIRSKFAIFVPNKEIVVTDPTCDEIMENAGYNVNSYVKINLGVKDYAFYNSTQSSELVTTGTTAKKFCATNLYDKSQLPNGSVIVVRKNYQYRPDGWKTLTTKTSSSERPGNVTTSLVVVDDAWWGSWNYRAFNLAKTDGSEIAEAELSAVAAGFCIYVPKTAFADIKSPVVMLKAMGYDSSKYQRETVNMTHNAFYNSTNGSAPGPDGLWTSASNSTQFAASDIYTSDMLLPGFVIVQLPGYMFRPEGWVTMKQVNANSIRPANVTAYATEVTADWFSYFKFRAFNVAKIGNPPLSAAEQAYLEEEFAIFSPIE